MPWWAWSDLISSSLLAAQGAASGRRQINWKSRSARPTEVYEEQEEQEEEEGEPERVVVMLQDVVPAGGGSRRAPAHRSRRR